jgi:hypothetical protein
MHSGYLASYYYFYSYFLSQCSYRGIYKSHTAPRSRNTIFDTKKLNGTVGHKILTQNRGRTDGHIKRREMDIFGRKVFSTSGHYCLLAGHCVWSVVLATKYNDSPKVTPPPPSSEL